MVNKVLYKHATPSISHSCYSQVIFYLGNDRIFAEIIHTFTRFVVHHILHVLFV